MEDDVGFLDAMYLAQGDEVGRFLPHSDQTGQRSSDWRPTGSGNEPLEKSECFFQIPATQYLAWLAFKHSVPEHAVLGCWYAGRLSDAAVRLRTRIHRGGVHEILHLGLGTPRPPPVAGPFASNVR